MGELAKKHAARIGELLNHPDPYVRGAAAEALGAMGEAAKEHAPRLVDLLKDDNSTIRTSAGDSLTAMAPLDLQHIAVILAVVGLEPGNRHEWLLRAHIAGG